MKEILIATIIALIFSCSLAAYQPASQAKAVGVFSVEASDAAISAEVKNIQVGELKLVNCDALSRVATQIKSDGSSSCGIQFPQARPEAK